MNVSEWVSKMEEELYSFEADYDDASEEDPDNYPAQNSKGEWEEFFAIWQAGNL